MNFSSVLFSKTTGDLVVGFSGAWSFPDAEFMRSDT